MSKIVTVDPVVVRVTEKTRWVFIRVMSDDGLTGFGEATLAGNEAQLVACIHQLGKALIEQGVSSTNALWPHFLNDRGGLPQRAAASAAEQALWDITGKRLGVPVYMLLGGAIRKNIPVYANINRSTYDRSPRGFAEKALKAVACGYHFIKISPFDEMNMGETGAVSNKMSVGIDRIRTVRDAVGPDINLMIDCHECFSEFTAIEMIRKVADLNLFWLESPIPEKTLRLDGLKRLRRQADELGIRFAGLEKGVGLEAYIPYLQNGIYDVIMPDVKYCGGIQAARNIAALADVYGVKASPHNPTGPVCHMASSHLAATLSNLNLLELQFDESPFFSELAAESIPQVENGFINLPEGPGLGIDLKEDVLRQITEVT